MADITPDINRYCELTDNNVKAQVEDWFGWKPFREMVLPRQLEIHLGNPTGKPCNFHCEHCQGRNLDRGVAVYDDAALKLLPQLDGKIPLFVLSGAYVEPFLNPRLIEYIRAIKKQGSSFGLHSNASFLKQREEESGFVTEMVALSGPEDYFTCAIDAATAPTFARLKKVGVGQFERAIEGLRLIADEKRKYKGQDKIKLRFTYLLNDDNSSLEELREMVRLAKGMDATSLRFSIPYAPHGTNMEGCADYRKQVEIPMQARLWENVKKVMSREEVPGETLVFSMPPEAQNIERLTFDHCFYGYFQITFGADGYVYRCSAVASPQFPHLRLGEVPDNLADFYDMIARNQVNFFNPQAQCFPHSGRCNRAGIDINTEYERRYYGETTV